MASVRSRAAAAVAVVAVVLALAAGHVQARAALGAAPLLDDPPFAADEVATMGKFFVANINIAGQGGVVASPDDHVPGGGSYVYHWERDGALTMATVLKLGDSILKPLTNASDDMIQYVKWVLRVQADQDPNNIDVRIEPKYLLPGGQVFTGAWCRPQNDGPALRSITLIAYANSLLDAGTPAGKAFVATNLWRPDSQMNGGAIAYDLDYVINHWQDNSCDLWEEVESTDFFWNRFHHRKALIDGAAFAQRMGNSSYAASLTAAAKKIEGGLSSHWNGQFILEEQNRQIDSAVICALNTGYANDNVFGPTDSQVASTIQAYSAYFNSAFDINGKDTQNGVPGILYGRYKGDTFGGGNPWILSTANLATLYYRGAQEVLATRRLPSEAAMRHWRSLLGLAADSVPSVQGLAAGMVTVGDGILQRIRYHVQGDGFHLSEQLDKETGYEVSAFDLTWSYAAVLEAVAHRSTTAAAFSAL